jgi:hypothetical protein
MFLGALRRRPVGGCKRCHQQECTHPHADCPYYHLNLPCSSTTYTTMAGMHIGPFPAQCNPGLFSNDLHLYQVLLP